MVASNIALAYVCSCSHRTRLALNIGLDRTSQCIHGPWSRALGTQYVPSYSAGRPTSRQVCFLLTTLPPAQACDDKEAKLHFVLTDAAYMPALCANTDHAFARALQSVSRNSVPRSDFNISRIRRIGPRMQQPLQQQRVPDRYRQREQLLPKRPCVQV